MEIILRTINYTKLNLYSKNKIIIETIVKCEQNMKECSTLPVWKMICSVI